jgi:SAM-dependent methyltransferase
MGQKFNRKKPRNYLTAVIYRIGKLSFAPDRVKFRLFCDLNWIFGRLAHETSMKIFDNNLHPGRIKIFDFLKNKISHGDTILDLGCGNGEISCKLSEICKSVIGIDHNPARIKYANDNCKNENLIFVCGDALEFLNVNKQKYDVLICSHILEHLDDPGSLLQNVKPFFSYIYIEVPDFESSYLNHIRSLLNVQLNYSDDDHVYEFDRDEIKELVTNQGMKIIDSEYRFGVMRYWIQI